MNDTTRQLSLSTDRHFSCIDTGLELIREERWRQVT